MNSMANRVMRCLLDKCYNLYTGFEVQLKTSFQNQYTGYSYSLAGVASPY